MHEIEDGEPLHMVEQQVHPHVDRSNEANAIRNALILVMVIDE
jgi:hypothetical protein